MRMSDPRLTSLVSGINKIQTVISAFIVSTVCGLFLSHIMIIMHFLQIRDGVPIISDLNALAK